MMIKIFKISIPIAILVFLAWLFFSPSLGVGYAPKQPIAYSHAFHTGTLNLDCRYCHTGVEKGSKAGVPPTSTCMNCHSAVGTSKPEIKKLIEKFNNNEPLEWIRVHNMPDHVRFSHAPHIKALSKEDDPIKNTCAPCHGQVSEMEVVEQVKPLNMGFCIECHRDNSDLGAKINCGVCHY